MVSYFKQPQTLLNLEKIQTSMTNWILGDGSFTQPPSRGSSKSFHNINSLLHLKYSKTITPVWSVSTQAYLAFAGLVNAPKMILRVVNSNILPQFAGRTVIILWNYSLPLASKSLIASAKMLRLMQFTGALEQCTSFSQVLVAFTKCTIWLFSLLQCS